MKKILKTSIVLILVGFTLYHSVYFRSLKNMKGKGDEINAAAYADKYFHNQLLPMWDSAVQLNDLLTMLKTNKEQAFGHHGHAMGIGSIRYFLVSGEGVIKAVEPNGVILQLSSDPLGAVYRIATEFVFGNAVRDAAGKLSLTEFSNLSDVNNISMELNKIVRTKVLPPFKKDVAADRRIRFFGAIELNQERLDLTKIEIVPIQLQFVN